jgi:hypothetical protein
MNNFAQASTMLNAGASFYSKMPEASKGTFSGGILKNAALSPLTPTVHSSQEIVSEPKLKSAQSVFNKG